MTDPTPDDLLQSTGEGPTHYGEFLGAEPLTTPTQVTAGGALLYERIDGEWVVYVGDDGYTDDGYSLPVIDHKEERLLNIIERLQAALTAITDCSWMPDDEVADYRMRWEYVLGIAAEALSHD